MEMGIFMGAFTDENFEVSHRAGFFRDRFKDFTGKPWLRWLELISSWL